MVVTESAASNTNTPTNSSTTATAAASTVLCIFASGLDIESLWPRMRRVHTTVLAAAVAVVLLFVGVFVFDAADSVTTMSVALNALATPWVVILLIGFLRNHRHYDARDLQAFAEGRHGRYWFTRGWNVPAVLVALVAGGVWVFKKVAGREAKPVVAPSAQALPAGSLDRRAELESKAVMDASGRCGWCGSTELHKDEFGFPTTPLKYHRAEIDAML